MYNGLNEQQVQERVSQGLTNKSDLHLTRSYEDIIRSNTLTYFNIVNAVLFVIVLTTGHLKNGMFFITIIVNSLIGIYQEIKAKKLLEKMEIMVAAKVPVCRSGQWKEIPVDEIVQDDLIRLESGMQIPADCLLLDGYLEVDESLLTGESEHVSHYADDEVSAGTVCMSGSCSAKVLRVGKECASSKIMEEARKYSKVKSELNENLNRLIRIVSVAIIPTGLILFATQYWLLNLTWQDAALKTVAAVVGMIPEGLVVLTSIALAVSTMRLSRRSVLVQDLFSIESLARVDVLCLDKTGTLTQGSMKVNELKPLLDHTRSYAEGIICSFMAAEEKPNATAKAMTEYFGRSEVFHVDSYLPFSSARKYTAAHILNEGTFYLGAVNFLFPKGCPAANRYLSQYTSEGKRVLILGRSKAPAIAEEGVPEDLDPVAMIMITDVLRDNVQEIMSYFQKQDVSLKVISGDDAATVSSLALQAGIPGAEHYVDMSTASASMAALAENHTVFGRVTPDQKKALIEALQENGHTVAMTGDGVNDVPALKTADVGVAMAAGASAAKDSANLVLLDNDFAHMPDIVDEGRRVINNISRAASMYLVKTVFSILLSLYVILLRQEYPFLPVHLTLITAVGVGIPTFLLQMEPSFERVKGAFFTPAFRNAVPAAVTVFLTALFCLAVRYMFHLPIERYYGIFVALTGYIYLYTLFRVYYPPTKIRIAVIAAMAVLLVLVLTLVPELFSVNFQFQDLAALMVGFAIIPFLNAALARAYDWIRKKTNRRKVVRHGKKNRSSMAAGS
ncbi:MAG: HAD family hydrolase [Erysipelotrichaceae bacterium]|nr:HAD family hydrolase [Erysipelotrichaceae bacterium]